MEVLTASLSEAVSHHVKEERGDRCVPSQSEPDHSCLNASTAIVDFGIRMPCI